MSELIYILGRYLGIYAKDSLDELLLTTHQSSSYGGKSREVERRAVGEWIVSLGDIDGLKSIRKRDETNEADKDVAKILGHMSEDGEWIIDPIIKNDVCWDSNDYNGGELGDNFPYIPHRK
jgi:hypothetical protein